MTEPVAARLPGNRLHLQHGPIDLIIGADGGREAAFEVAWRRFRTVLSELVEELPLLRQPVLAGSALLEGSVALRMDRATRALRNGLTPMAAVAGAVADEILEAMCNAAPLSRAYVNNGGDIALHLEDSARFDLAIQCVDGTDLGRVALSAEHGIGGIATSGRHGRSLSLGIADSVTVLAGSAAEADAAATLVANTVDVVGHPRITRTPACDLDPDSDLGERLVVTRVGPLTRAEVARALTAGLACAERLHTGGHISGAALFLKGDARILGPQFDTKRELEHA